MEHADRPTHQSKENPDFRPSTPPRGGVVLKVVAFALALVIASGLALFRVYGTDTHHADRSGIWWPARCRDLIPPAATDITLRRDALDHHAIYTISEKDLNAFLDDHFARQGETLDSFRERTPAEPRAIGNVVGPLGWVVTKDTVSYSYTAGNGGVHEFHHDTKTGRTYQSSAYW